MLMVISLIFVPNTYLLLEAPKENNRKKSQHSHLPISREGDGGVRPFAGEHGTASASGDPAPHQRQGCQAGGRCRAGGGAPTTFFFAVKETTRIRKGCKICKWFHAG